MPPRSLRRGDKCPNPGAVHKGCPRPKALRFASPFGGASPFGDGSYSGNIMQGGVPLQPKDYLLDGVTPFKDCIVITGTATVAPDSGTGAAVFMCRNLVIIGASASLSASTNCKGLIGFVAGKTILLNGAIMSMSKLGKAGNFGDLTVFDLVPRSICKCLKKSLSAYVVKGENPSGAAGILQTGAGNTMNGPYYWGSVHKGGPCCGGAGDSRNNNAGYYGGPGGDSYPGDSSHPSGAGAGDPPGVSTDGGSPGTGAGGGLLMLFSSELYLNSGCFVEANGADGGAGGFMGGGGAGGGCIVVITQPSGYANAGTVRANGGRSGRGGNQPSSVVWAFAGSVNIFELVA